MSKRPYKFLNYYTPDEADIFFGRERESRILLSDIVVNRLVVLFAKTGTGKTSLINAGVIPRLKERGYEPFFIRVSKDPVQSLRRALLDHPSKISLKGDESLPVQLKNVAKRLKMPIVLIFDQFEEFFNYMKADSTEGKQFIQDVASVYDNQDWQVHIVFSMREEWFVEMDSFRDDIPSIYHNGSNLRLRKFDKDQASDAISLPPRKFGVTVNDDLTRQVIHDLSDDDGKIEPTQLQIVCDTLWDETERERRNSSNGFQISLSHYLKLGRGQQSSNIAIQILFQRLEERFENIETAEEFKLLDRLLPELRTSRGTKFVREIDELTKTLGVDRDLLDDLLNKLQDSRLIKIIPQDGTRVVELLHDYLVDRLEELQVCVRGIPPRRIINKYKIDGELATGEDLEKILEGVRHLKLSAAQAQFLLRSALDHRLPLLPWFELAVQSGLQVWPILYQKLQDAAADRETPDNEAIARTIDIVELLGRVPAKESVELLSQIQTLQHDLFSSRVAESLELLTKSVDNRVAVKAEEVLIGLLDVALQEDEDSANSAIDTLGRIQEVWSVNLLERTLKQDDLALQAHAALKRLTRSDDVKLASLAQRAVETFLESALKRKTLAATAIDELGRRHTLTSVSLLENALKLDEFAPKAEGALEKLAKSTNADVSAQALNTLNYYRKYQKEREREVSNPVNYAGEYEPSTSSGYKTSTKAPVAHISDLIRRGQIIPFLGPGASFNRSPMAQWDETKAFFLPTSIELAQFLARRISFPALGDDRCNLAEVASFYVDVVGRRRLREQLRSIFDNDFQPSDLHEYLAGIDVPLLIITTNYDDLIEKAFERIGRPYDLVFHSTDRKDIAASVLWWEHGVDEPVAIPTNQLHIDLNRRTVIYKMHGTVDRRQAQWDSYIITEEDYVDLFTRMFANAAVPAQFMRHFRTRGFLFLGLGLSTWNDRVLQRNLLSKSLLMGEKIPSLMDEDELDMSRSWSIVSGPSEMEAELWRSRRVSVYDIELNDFVHHLREYEPKT